MGIVSIMRRRAQNQSAGDPLKARARGRSWATPDLWKNEEGSMLAGGDTSQDERASKQLCKECAGGR